MYPISLHTFFFLNQKVSKSTINQHYKFGISYYKSCIECDVHITLCDFFKRTFVSPGEHDYILKSCSHKDTEALCLVNRSLKYDDASKDWITEETILSAVTFQLKKNNGAFILHRATSDKNLNKLIPHDLDFENFVPNVQGLGFGFLLMEVLHSLSYTITHSDKIFWAAHWPKPIFMSIWVLNISKKVGDLYQSGFRIPQNWKEMMMNFFWNHASWKILP